MVSYSRHLLRAGLQHSCLWAEFLGQPRLIQSPRGAPLTPIFGQGGLSRRGPSHKVLQGPFMRSRGEQRALWVWRVEHPCCVATRCALEYHPLQPLPRALGMQIQRSLRPTAKPMIATVHTSGGAAGFPTHCAQLGGKGAGADTGSLSPSASGLAAAPATPPAGHATELEDTAMGCVTDRRGKQQCRVPGRSGRLQWMQRRRHQRRRWPLAGTGDRCTAFEALLAAAEACQASCMWADSHLIIDKSASSNLAGQSTHQPLAGGGEQDGNMLG